MQPFIEKYQTIIVRIIVIIALLLALFLFAATVAKMKQIRFIGSGLTATNTITVSGQGKVERAPDTARVTFNVRSESRNVQNAQTTVSEKVTAITKALRDAGIEARHIKTESYSSYPQYTYSENGGAPTIRGYEVMHAITVAIKDLEKVDEVLGILGTQGASDISGPNLGFEDDKVIAREARDLAIEDAKNEAQKLAKSLGVDLVRIVSFSEQGGGNPIPLYERAGSVSMQAKDSANVALPVGDQKVQSSVVIVYEIR